MNKSENIAALAKALSTVQSKLNPAIKDSTNPFFKNRYADLNSVWDACRALLTENGLSVAQVNQITLEGVIIETVLMHESGEWISGELYLPLTKQDAQGVGSAMTYGRRYGLAAMVGIVADVDDDGQAASQPKQTMTKPKPNVDTIGNRIENAIKEIQKLGGKVERIGEGESETDYFDSLVSQYNTLKSREK